MALFRPWVGEKKVHARGASIRQEPAEDVTAFEAEDADICQAHAGSAAADFFHTAAKALDAKEVALRIVLRHFEEKHSVAAADIELQRARSVRKDFRAAEVAEIVVRNQFDAR